MKFRKQCANTSNSEYTACVASICAEYFESILVLRVLAVFAVPTVEVLILRVRQVLAVQNPEVLEVQGASTARVDPRNTTVSAVLILGI